LEWCLYDGVLPFDEFSFERRLQTVETRIESALRRCGRQRSDITLVAVTKKFSAERIREAYQAGVRDIGENYVQEFAEKRPQLPELTDARFHLIGHLQSNKVRLASELFQVIETADSVKLLKRLDAVAAERSASPEVLLELKLAAEETKTGASPEDLPSLLEAAALCKHVHVTGLMTVPPWSDDAEQSRPYFRQLRALAEKFGLRKLSMGMSGDLEVAIEEGATMIRVGTALFGRRPKTPSPSNMPDT
jgi:PLP dependent protein